MNLAVRIGSLAAAVAIALPAAAGSARAHRDAPPATGLKTIAYSKVPPDFAFDVGTGATRLSAQFGKPVVLNFWATWCHPCLDELDVFTRLQHDYGERTTLITLSSEAAGVARTYLHDRRIVLPVAEDPVHQVFDAYSIGPIPVTLVLRPDGTVSHVSVGELDWNELSRAVDDVLTARPARTDDGTSGAHR